MPELVPADPEEFARHSAGSTTPTEFRHGLWSLAMPLSAGHISYTLSYLISDGRRGVHVIDPGALLPGNWEILVAALHATGFSVEDVASVVITHLHPDHVGLAGRLADEAGVPVTMHEQDVSALTRTRTGPRSSDVQNQVARWHVPDDRREELLVAATPSMSISPISAFIEVASGHPLEIPDREVVVVHTPGHTRGSMTIASMNDQVVFTGDHVLPNMFPGVGLGSVGDTNPIRDYISSLDALAEFDDFEVAPGHGYRFTGLGQRRRASADHHLARSAEVARALLHEPGATVWSVAETLSWTAGWAGLSGFYLRSALAQTEMHMDLLREGYGGVS